MCIYIYIRDEERQRYREREFQKKRERESEGGMYREGGEPQPWKLNVLAKNICKQSLAQGAIAWLEAVTSNRLVKEQSIGHQSLG